MAPCKQCNCLFPAKNINHLSLCPQCATPTTSQQLSQIANSLTAVAGYLMHVATSNGRCAAQPDEHDESCNCQCFQALLATQDAITKLSNLADNP